MTFATTPFDAPEKLTAVWRIDTLNVSYDLFVEIRKLNDIYSSELNS